MVHVETTRRLRFAPSMNSYTKIFQQDPFVHMHNHLLQCGFYHCKIKRYSNDQYHVNIPFYKNNRFTYLFQFYVNKYCILDVVEHLQSKCDQSFLFILLGKTCSTVPYYQNVKNSSTCNTIVDKECMCFLPPMKHCDLRELKIL